MRIRPRRDADARARGLPGEVLRAVGLGKGERVLAETTDIDTGVWLVATNHCLVEVFPGRDDEGAGLSWKRPWHDVDSGTWGRDSSQLTVTWVHRGRPGQWHLDGGPVSEPFLRTVRERVQASVVLSEEFRLTGRRGGRAVIRQDLRTGDLLQQVVLARGMREDDEVSVAADRALTYLREQVGMPHP